MTPGAILTLGLGDFSNANHLVTLGYGAAAEVAPVSVIAPAAVGGGGVTRRYGIQDRYWRELDQRYRKKKREAEKKSVEAVEIVEDIAGRQASLAASLEQLTEELKAARITNATIYRDLLRLEFERKRHEEDVDDEDVILLSLH